MKLPRTLGKGVSAYRCSDVLHLLGAQAQGLGSARSSQVVGHGGDKGAACETSHDGCRPAPFSFPNPMSRRGWGGGEQSWLTVFPPPGLGIELLSGSGFCCRAWSWLVLFSGPWRILVAPGWVWFMHSLPAPAIQRPSASRLADGRLSKPNPPTRAAGASPAVGWQAMPPGHCMSSQAALRAPSFFLDWVEPCLSAVTAHSAKTAFLGTQTSLELALRDGRL